MFVAHIQKISLVQYTSGVDKQGAYAPPVTTMYNIFKARFCINVTDDIDIAIPSVRLSVRDTPE